MQAVPTKSKVQLEEQDQLPREADARVEDDRVQPEIRKQPALQILAHLSDMWHQVTSFLAFEEKTFTFYFQHSL